MSGVWVLDDLLAELHGVRGVTRRRCAIAELVEAAPNGAEGEGIWRVLLGDGSIAKATVQPSKDVPGEKWIARGYHKGLEAHLGGSGSDALDAVLGLLEDHAHRLKHGRSSPMVAVTGDSRAKRPHRAEQLELGTVSRGPTAPAPDRAPTLSAKDEAGNFERPTRAASLARAVAARARKEP